MREYILKTSRVEQQIVVRRPTSNPLRPGRYQRKEKNIAGEEIVQVEI